MNKQGPHRLLPKLFQSLQGYHRQDIFPDLIAGLTVGLVALPLAMAFAISSGVKPEAGIYTAIVAGFLVSALGGSRCQIAGPTGAFVVIVAGIVTKFGVPGLLMCTMMAGVILIVLAFASATLGLDVETIGSKFGGIPTGFPDLAIPEFRPELILPLIPSAVTVALLAAIESLLSAVVADNMSGDRHRPNAELLAQGVANVLVPMVGGIPATGAIARTATNIRAGARSPIAGIVHAVTLLGILFVGAPLARFIPLATLAAVLFVVAYNMSEWREIGAILRSSRADRVVWIATFGLTVFADLTVAVEMGMVLAAMLYIYQVTETTSVEPVTHDYIRDGQVHILQDKIIPPYVSILRIHGPFPFWSDRETGGSDCRFDPVQQDRHTPPKEHDGRRRDRPPRDRGPGETTTRRRTLACSVRRPQTASQAPETFRACPLDRPPEHRAEYQSRLGARHIAVRKGW